MRHHFGDMLDRDGDYWTTVPNRERYDYRIEGVPAGSPDVTILTIGKQDEAWERVFTLPNLEELTLHEPSNAQLDAIRNLRQLKRLRITHARPRSIAFLRPMRNVEELVLEYVSGFDDLAPLQELPRLRALHMENLRRVHRFDGLAGLPNLRYLAIQGTLDWCQPIEDFEFLRGLPDLEVLSLFQVVCKKPYPALLPVLALRNLKRLKLSPLYLRTEEYAFLEVALEGVEGAAWGPWSSLRTSQKELSPQDIRAHLPADVIRQQHPEVTITRAGRRLIDDPATGRIDFTGRGAGYVDRKAATAEARCKQLTERYETLKEAARILVAQEKTRLASLATSAVAADLSQVKTDPHQASKS